MAQAPFEQRHGSKFTHKNCFSMYLFFHWK